MDNDVAAVAGAIAAHLLVNPQASDTAIGIARWWLPDSLGSDMSSLNTVTTALSWMTELGLVEELSAADGRTRYRRGAPDAALRQFIEHTARGTAGPGQSDSSGGTR
jgi:hypothetical protein